MEKEEESRLDGLLGLGMKPLCEYTDRELYRFLKNNEEQPSDVLAWVCSEVLRRTWVIGE